jgi:hypothetical protein
MRTTDLSRVSFCGPRFHTWPLEAHDYEERTDSTTSIFRSRGWRTDVLTRSSKLPKPSGKRERARFSRYAKATFKKDRRLNIRLSSKDLEAIQKRALAEGLPYQTLISSLLDKYAAGRLKEV